MATSNDGLETVARRTRLPGVPRAASTVAAATGVAVAAGHIGGAVTQDDETGAGSTGTPTAMPTATAVSAPTAGTATRDLSVAIGRPRTGAAATAVASTTAVTARTAAS